MSKHAKEGPALVVLQLWLCDMIYTNLIIYNQDKTIAY